jgi:hypothetical protein
MFLMFCGRCDGFDQNQNVGWMESRPSVVHRCDFAPFIGATLGRPASPSTASEQILRQHLQSRNRHPWAFDKEENPLSARPYRSYNIPQGTLCNVILCT